MKIEDKKAVFRVAIAGERSRFIIDAVDAESELRERYDRVDRMYTGLPGWRLTLDGTSRVVERRDSDDAERVIFR